MHHPFRHLLLAAAVLCTPAWAQQPSPATAPQPLHAVTGFRSALFGMTAAEVRAAIARDFNAAPDVITEVENPLEKTKVLAVRLASLEPAPGPVVLTYVLGAATQRLVHVNLTWASGPAPSDEERNRMGVAGLQLANHFRGLGWKPGGAILSQREGANAVLLFAGVDPKDAAVEVHLAGIYLTGKDGVSASPAGPVTLRVSYIANLRKRDVAMATATTTAARE
jgi:hypothetical protein